MYALQVATLVLIYIMIGSGANVAIGYSGLVSICHAVFYAAGAYVSTLLIIDQDLPFLQAAIVAIVVAALLAGATGAALLRLGDDYFVVATIGWQLIFWSILNNWQSLTRGPLGIPGIRSVTFWGRELSDPLAYGALVAGVTAAVIWVTARLAKSPYGRVLRAVRDDPDVAAALGKDIRRFKISAMVISGAIAGLAGCLYAPFARFIDPAGFTLSESVLILSIVVVGGAGDVRGPVLGALILITIPEALRFVGLPAAIAANLRQILYGILLIVAMLYRPRGLVGSYGFERRAGTSVQ